ncbi:MAG: sensor histidine kinase, partial [Ignavibacteriaceae bacterium]
YSIENKRITFSSNFDETFLEIDTGILCGLIINELISNSLKHAFPNGRKGEIFISMHLTPQNKYDLLFKDNGIGFPDNIDFRNTDSLGLQLVTSLTSQLGGEIELKKNGSTEFEIIFPAGFK